MKKRCLFAGLAICILSMTGCASAISLTDAEEDMIAQSIAEIVLYDQENYTEALIEPTPTLEPTQAPTATPSVSNDSQNVNSPSGSKDTTNQQANSDFVTVIGMSGISAEYNKYEIVESLKDDASNVQPAKGNELMVVTFHVTNTTKKDKKFVLGDLNIDYMLDVNTDTKIRPLLTLKENDLRYIDVLLKAGETKETILVFEIKKKLKIDSLNLIISRDDKTAIVKIK